MRCSVERFFFVRAFFQLWFLRPFFSIFLFCSPKTRSSIGKSEFLFNNELGSNALIAHGLQIWPLVSGKVDYGPAQATRGQGNAAMGKAKPTKHTAAELKKKEADATTNKGGGNAGINDRKGGAAGHSKWACKVCAQAAPDPKSLQAHFESKHSKMGPVSNRGG